MNKSVAYFSMEYALSDALPIFAGGLGVLAADYFLEASKSDFFYYFFGLYYKHGFVTTNDTSLPIFNPEDAGFKLLKDENDEIIAVDIEIKQRPLLAQVWHRQDGNAHLLLLDTNLPGNSDEDKAICDRLYGPDSQTMLLQQIVIGIGGVKLLRRLGIKPDIYHLNEGHTSFVLFGLLALLKDEHGEMAISQGIEQIKPTIVGSKHTILHGSGMFVEKETFENLFSIFAKRHDFSLDELYKLGDNYTEPDKFSTNALFLNHCIRANCVSGIHCAFEIGVHPNSTLLPVTNGVNKGRWQAKNLQENNLANISDDQLWQFHQENKKQLLDFVKLATSYELQSTSCTIDWSRRLTHYKRPLLLLSDLDRLDKIVNNPKMPVQIVISGQASSSDMEGQNILRKIIEVTNDSRFRGKIVYLPGYNLTLASKLVAGTDVWLNTPELGKEACGTSGMKAGLNGALEFSVPDGWFAEVDWTNKGWVLKEENITENLYSILESAVIPCYYNIEPASNSEARTTSYSSAWIQKMRQTMEIIEKEFTTTRMMKDYQEKLYFGK